MLINIQNTRKNLTLLLTLFMIAAVYIKIPPARAQITPTIFIDPPTYTATHRGEIVSLDINMRDLEEGLNVIGAEFKLGFDHGIFEFGSIVEGPFFKSFAAAPNEGTYFVYLSKANYILVAVVIMPDASGDWHAPFPNGGGTLATISFEVIDGPAATANFTLYDTKLSDTNGVPPGVAHNSEDATFNYPVEYLAHNIGWDGSNFIVTTESNSTISEMDFAIGHQITFTVTGETGTTGCTFIELPRAFMDGTFSIVINGIPTPYATWQNETHTRLYFVYTHSTKAVTIFGTFVVSEFHSAVLVLAPFVACLVTAVMKTYTGKYRRKQ